MCESLEVTFSDGKFLLSPCMKFSDDEVDFIMPNYVAAYSYHLNVSSSIKSSSFRQILPLSKWR